MYVYLAFLLALLWGAYPVVIKYFMKNHQIPIYILLLTQAVIYIFSILVYLMIFKYDQVHLDIRIYKNYIPIIAAGFLLLFITNFLYMYAIQKDANVVILTIITALHPVVTVISAYFILGEKLSKTTFLGLCLILVGVIIVLQNGSSI